MKLVPVLWPDAQQMAHKQAQETAVGHDKGCLVCRQGSQPTGEVACPPADFGETFASGILQVEAPLQPGFYHFGIALFDLVKGQTFKFTKANLSYLGAYYNLYVVLGGDNLGGG